MDASETYETIARASKIKSITAAGYSVTITDEGLANVGGTTVRKLTSSTQPGVTNVGIGIIQTLPTTEDPTPSYEGYTLNINYKFETSGAITDYGDFTIDGVPIVTKDDLTTAQADTLSKSNPGSDYVNKITYGSSNLTPNNGVIALPQVYHIVNTSQEQNATRYTIGTIEKEGGSNETGFIQNFDFDVATNDDYGDGRNVVLNVSDNRTNVVRAIRLVSYKEMQEYITSLDGTNVGF